MLLGLLAGGLSAGLASITLAFRSTRLGAVLIAIIVSQVITPGIPTHALEAALLVWAFAMRIRGRTFAAIALATAAVFVKISMGTVMVLEFAGLAVLDAIRTRSARPLVALAAVPLVAVAGVGIGASTFGLKSLASGFDPGAGAAVYRAYDLGFFREGRNFWHPAGHTIGWYVGGLAGVWIVASLVLCVFAARGAVRILRATFARTENATQTADEANVIAGFANLAFILAFFAPSAGCVYYYCWVPLAGLIPALASAHFGPRADRPWAPLGWAAVGLGLVLSSTAPLRAFAQFLREPRVRLGGLSVPLDEADEWKSTMALAHSVGDGAVTAVARVANFDVVEPSVREARYWMMLKGMRNTPALDELMELVRTSDTLLVTKHDYDQILPVPEFHALLTTSERLHDGKYFLLLRNPRDTGTTEPRSAPAPRP
jgi:hypothetical protein